MTLILIRTIDHISNILTVLLTQKHVFRTKHVYALSPSNIVVFFFSFFFTSGFFVATWSHVFHFFTFSKVGCYQFWGKFKKYSKAANVQSRKWKRRKYWNIAIRNDYWTYTLIMIWLTFRWFSKIVQKIEYYNYYELIKLHHWTIRCILPVLDFE